MHWNLWDNVDTQRLIFLPLVSYLPKWAFYLRNCTSVDRVSLPISMKQGLLRVALSVAHETIVSWLSFTRPSQNPSSDIYIVSPFSPLFFQTDLRWHLLLYLKESESIVWQKTHTINLQAKFGRRWGQRSGRMRLRVCIQDFSGDECAYSRRLSEKGIIWVVDCLGLRCFLSPYGDMVGGVMDFLAELKIAVMAQPTHTSDRLQLLDICF